MSRIVLARMGRYMALFALAMLVVSLAYNALDYSRRSQAPSAGTLDMKIPYYRAHAHDYGMIFMGDSRTLTDVHPAMLEAAPGWPRTLKAFNLGHWANWLPTQYALFHDIVDDIPPGTIVVWSVGHKNFDMQQLKAAWPVGWKRIPLMLRLGYDPDDVFSNQLAFTPALALPAQRAKIWNKIDSLMQTPLAFLNASPAAGGTARATEDEMIRFRNAPDAYFMKPWRDEHGRLVSVEQYGTDGAYLRTEIDSGYYRAKQREDIAARTDPPLKSFTPVPSSMTLFRDILALCRARKIRLVVNEIEEAPYIYATPVEKSVYRAFMRGTVQAEVENAGFPYVRIDFDRFNDADYFDYNHMNSSGAEKFTTLFAPALLDAARKAYPDAF